MIHEIIQWLLNPGSKYARKLGYSKELVAINARYRRHQGLWQAHLEKSKQCIIKASSLCEKKNAVVVIGAGLLFDVPLEFLAKQFHQVTLIDIVFSRNTVSTCKKWKNVECVEYDITGLSTSLFTFSNHSKIVVPHARLPEFIPSPDLVVSANVLSQLYLAPVNYLSERFDFTEQELFDFSVSLIQAHLELLKSFNGRSCLITDHQRIRVFKNAESEIEHTLAGVELPTPDETWQWKIAPFGEIDNNSETSLEVIAYYAFN